MKKMLCAMLAVLCLGVLAGCGSETVESNVPEVLKTVPTLTVHCGENSTEGLQGTHEWWYANGDGTQTSFIADSLHPLQCKDYMTPLTILPSTQSSQPITARLEFSVMPDKIVAARRWSVDSFHGPGEPVDDVGTMRYWSISLSPRAARRMCGSFSWNCPTAAMSMK